MTLIEKFQTESAKFLTTRIHNFHVDNGGEHQFVNSMIVNTYNIYLLKDSYKKAIATAELFNKTAKTAPFEFKNLWINKSMQVQYQFFYFIEQLNCKIYVNYSNGVASLECNHSDVDCPLPEDIEESVLKDMINEVSVSNSFGLLIS